MPKMKTRRSAAKRFKVTAGKKVIGQHAYGSHILTKKSRKRKRKLRKGTLISKTDEKRILRNLPYGS